MNTSRQYVHRAVSSGSALLLSSFALALGGCPIPTDAWPPADIALEFNIGAVPTPAMANGEPVYRRGKVFESVPGKNGCHAPSITAFEDGELLAAWFSYDGPEEVDGAAIYTARRPAGSEVWGPPALHIDRDVADGNPVLYSEGDAVWMFQIVVWGRGGATAHIEVQRSFDRGHTWTEPTVINGPLGANTRFPPVRTADGTLLLPAYDDLIQRSLIFASDDGEHWEWRSIIWTDLFQQNLQPTLVLLDSGRILAVMRNWARGWLWASASDDGGRSWAKPINSGFPNPGSSAGLLKLASGNLILAFNNSNVERQALSIALSADEGRTWHTPRVLIDGERTYSYPSMIQTPDGLIHIVYSHTREWIGHFIVNEAWILNGGEQP